MTLHLQSVLRLFQQRHHLLLLLAPAALSILRTVSTPTLSRRSSKRESNVPHCSPQQKSSGAAFATTKGVPVRRYDRYATIINTNRLVSKSQSVTMNRQ
jgi:hypothetical protein